MCTPPFCYPAQRALGYFTLRKASAAVVCINSLYGVVLVMVHVLIFRDYGSDQEERRLEEEASRHQDNWYLQLLDMDLAWAHGLIGVSDWWLCTCGVIYGIVIIVFSLFILHAVLALNDATAQSTAILSRWYMMFLHLELILYVVLVFLKMLLLCRIKNHYLKLMDEDCSILRYTFAERSCFRMIFGSWCCWIFSSFAYYLAWGDAIIDDPQLPNLPSAAPPPLSKMNESEMQPPVKHQADRYSHIPQVQMPIRSSLEHRPFVGQPVSTSYKYHVIPKPDSSYAENGAGGYVGNIRVGGTQRWLN
jgi:hypothetical protein